MISTRTLYNKYNGDLDFNTFKKVLDRYNQIILDRIIEKQELFDMGFNLGKLLGLEKERLYKQNENGTIITGINWPKSKEFKKKLIAEGKTPKEGDNGGVPWLIYNTTTWVMKFFWMKKRRKHDKEEGKHYYPLSFVETYKFVPIARLRKRLTKFKFDNQDISFTLGI